MIIPWILLAWKNLDLCCIAQRKIYSRIIIERFHACIELSREMFIETFQNFPSKNKILTYVGQCNGKHCHCMPELKGLLLIWSNNMEN